MDTNIFAFLSQSFYFIITEHFKITYCIILNVMLNALCSFFIGIR